MTTTTIGLGLRPRLIAINCLVQLNGVFIRHHPWKYKETGSVVQMIFKTLIHFCVFRVSGKHKFQCMQITNRNNKTIIVKTSSLFLSKEHANVNIYIIHPSIKNTCTNFITVMNKCQCILLANCTLGSVLRGLLLLCKMQFTRNIPVLKGVNMRRCAAYCPLQKFRLWIIKICT